jgi:putative ABC transport system permease protein
MRRRAQRQIIAVYILQVMALRLAGSLLGVGMRARRSRDSARARLVDVAAGEAHYGVTGARRAGIGIGVLVSLLFSIVPLLQVRFIKPSLLLRTRAGAAAATGPAIVVLVVAPRWWR